MYKHAKSALTTDRSPLPFLGICFIFFIFLWDAKIKEAERMRVEQARVKLIEDAKAAKAARNTN
jgi:hypothetical protein